MKKILTAALLLFIGLKSYAQNNPLDLGGITQGLASIVVNARYGTAVDFNKNISGVIFVPYPALKSKDGQTEYAALGLGADLSKGVKGTKLHGSPLIIPLVSITGLSTLLTRGNWASQHLAFPNLGINFEIGIGINPLPLSGTDGKWIIGNQIEGVATIGRKFGSTPLPSPI